ncbi:retroviral-like aspartic protease family protein [Dyella terrae]|uniref:retroviral-like aspartic protease family protein n=1 Tax=Dyella terrae TaxID=522259 RepID=UPI001EFD34A6|nr:retroviral-like aspartic protease family protein [Dyella terrae]ULU23877.1 aspartyl protease family protein [Dyella terrae]
MRRLLMSLGVWSMAVTSVCGVQARSADRSVDPQVALSASPNGHDTVPVYVNGKGPYPFILDTGADGPAVYQWFADEARLPKVAGKEQDLSGQTGSAKVSMFRIDDVSLGGLHYHGAEAFGLPDRKDGGQQAGVLGNDFMDKAVVVFDFPCRQVTIYPTPTDVQKILGGAHVVHAGVDEGTTLLTLPVTVNGAQGIAVLDSGSRQTRLTPGFASKAGIDVASSTFHDDTAIYGTSGNKRVPRTGPVGEVRFAGLTLTNATAQVVDLPMLADDFHGEPAMLLGADLIGRYRLIYDHASKTVGFDASRCEAH